MAAELIKTPIDPYVMREYHKDVSRYFQEMMDSVQRLNTYPLFLPNIETSLLWMEELIGNTDISFGVYSGATQFYYKQENLMQQAPTIPIVRNGIFRIPAYDFRIEYLGYRNEAVGRMHGFVVYNVQKLKGYQFPKVNIFKALSLGGSMYGFR